MQSQLAGAVRRAFDAELRRALPHFKKEPGLGSASSRSYVWHAPEVTFFLRLQLNAHWEWFTVEVAWSRSGSFPWDADMLESPVDLDATEKRFWLVSLWDKRRQKDYWWELAPMPELEDVQAVVQPPRADTLLPRVEGLVRDCVARIVKYAVPYFEDVRRALAANLPP